MVYDFTSEGAPKGTNSVKWDMKPEGLSGKADGKNLLPMWVAEMDFPAAPFIVEALHRRIDKRVFGYTLVPDSYYSCVIDWFSRRHGWEIGREQIIPILERWFDNDVERIRYVLGDNGKTRPDTIFYRSTPFRDNLFRGDIPDDFDRERIIYQLNEDAFLNPRSYITVYE